MQVSLGWGPARSGPKGLADLHIRWKFPDYRDGPYTLDHAARLATEADGTRSRYITANHSQ